MKKISGILLILLFFIQGSLSASIKIVLTAPTVTGGPYNGYTAAQIQAELDAGIAEFQTEIDSSDLSKLQDQKKMAAGFADAAGYTSYAGSLDGYQGYDIFAIMAGVSAGVRLPGFNTNYKKMTDEITDELEENKDASVGVGISESANLGLNITPVKNRLGLKRILRNRMYINFKYFSYSRDVQDFSFDSTTYGIGLNYQLVDRRGDRFRLFKWTGLSIGTGFIRSSNTTSMKMDFDEYLSAPIEIQANTLYAKMGFTPDTTFRLNVKNNVIPVEISTSFRILWMFNFTFGAGMDFTVGKSDISADAVSDMKAYYSTTQDGTYSEVQTTAGSGNAVINAKTSGEPELTHYRLTAGIGICLGPVPVDLKVNAYPLDHGASINISTGIVW